MHPKKYLNFDLIIEKAPHGFRARVNDSPAGSTSREFQLPFTQQEIEDFLICLNVPRKRTRRFQDETLETAKEFGARLFAALIREEIQRCLHSSLVTASAQGAGLRIRLNPATPELAGLPWEFLYHPAVDRFLSLSNELLISRYAALPEPAVPLAVELPLRVLAMLPNPVDDEVAPLDVEAEWSILAKATHELQRQGLVIVDRLEPASLSVLQRQLQLKEYSIFHFIGQSSLLKSTQDGVLVVEDDQKQARFITGQELGEVLKGFPTLKLAVIDACEGGRTSVQDAFGKIAQEIVQAGVPAVVTMQFAVAAQTAIAFSRELYREVIEGNPIDATLVEIRRVVRQEVNTMEWASPALFMGPADGMVFTIHARPGPPLPAAKRPLANLFIRQGPQAGENFPLFGEVYLIGRDEELPIYLQDAQVSRRHAQILFNSLGFWVEDLDSTNGTFVNGQRITGKAPLRNKDTVRLGNTTLVFDQENLPKGQAKPQLTPPAFEILDEINEQEERQRIEITALWAEAWAARAQQQWGVLIELLEAILRLDPDHPKANSELAVARRKQQIPLLYEEVREAQAQGDWERAIIKLQAVLNLDPAHQAARDEIQQAQQRMRSAVFYHQAQEALAQNNRALAIAKLQALLAVDPGYPRARQELEALL